MGPRSMPNSPLHEPFQDEPLEPCRLLIVRGLPGSGKTHAANTLKENFVPGAVVVSPDDYFVDGMKFVYNHANLNKADTQCLENCKLQMESKMALIIVDSMLV